MKSAIQEYIYEVIQKDAKITYDKSVKQWSGALHHESGDIYSQQKTKGAVLEEMKEVLEEFLVRFLQQKSRLHNSVSTFHRAKAHDTQIPRFYQQA